MNLNTVTVAAESEMSFGDRVLYGLPVLLLGMGIVFLSLCALWLVIEVFHRIINRKPKEKQGTEPEIAPLPPDAIPKPIVEAAEKKAEAPVTDDGAVVAAITAAISAMLEEEAEEPVGFRVVSFRRSGNGRAWNSNQ